MKARNLLLVCNALIAYPQSGYAQSNLTMSATGTSSLLFRGNTIGVNVTDASLEFGVNNLGRAMGQDRCWVWGTGARAGNSSGVGNIFTAGDFIAGATADGYTGLSWSNGQLPHADRLLIGSLDKLKKDFEKDYHRTMRETAVRIISDPRYADFLVHVLDALNPELRTPEEALAEIKKADVNDQKLKPLLAAYIAHLDGKHKELTEAFATRKEEVEDLLGEKQKREHDSAPYQQWIVFGFGGINGNSFKLVDGFDTVNVAKSFSKEEFRGGYFGLGVNYQRGRLGFGFTYQYTHTNNLGDLTKTDFTIRTSRTTGSTTLINEEKVTGYSGNYGTIELNQVNVDLMWNLPIDDKNMSQVLLSPYARFNIASRDTTLLKNTWNLGLGGYFVDKAGKFIGGLYVELPDVDNAVEKAKPVAEQNLRPAEMRITFGIVAKVTLGSIMKLY